VRIHSRKRHVGIVEEQPRHHLTAGPAWGPERNNHPLNRMVEMERCDELDEPLDETRLAMAIWISKREAWQGMPGPSDPLICVKSHTAFLARGQ
jgi:hypothetical protein